MTRSNSGTVSVVIGGQYGSEAKGEFTPYLTKLVGARHVVRTGGPNAGHTVTSKYGTFKMRQIPTSWMVNVHTEDDPRPPVLYIGSGSLINPEVLTKELAMVGRTCAKYDLPHPSIFIDESAIIISDEHTREEHAMGMRDNIGSTTEGIGAARSDHVLRSPGLNFALDWLPAVVDDLRQNEDLFGWNIYGCLDRSGRLPVLDVANVSGMLDEALHDYGENVIIESTQGFGLSLVHSGHYPYATSRDVTPGIILNDAGLSSREDHLVYSVIRTMPIRVAGNSGPLHKETSWDELQRRIPHLVEPETTTVTGNQRRIAKEMDWNMLQKMVRHCRPDGLYLTFLDYTHPELHEN